MLTVSGIYKEFLLQVNKNDTNTNINVSKAVFVILFNQQKRAWLDDATKIRESSDYIEDIESVLTQPTQLVKVSSTSQTVDFALPDNFFKEVSSYSICTKGQCKDKILTTWIVKPKNVPVLLQNDNQNPSFDWEETIAVLNNNKLSVYYTDFTITDTYLTYYREPIDIDIAGYIHIDGTASTDIMVDLDTINIEEIINRTAVAALRNYESYDQMQAQQQAQQQKERLEP